MRHEVLVFVLGVTLLVGGCFAALELRAVLEGDNGLMPATPYGTATCPYDDGCWERAD